jgi:MFS family permease
MASATSLFPGIWPKAVSPESRINGVLSVSFLSVLSFAVVVPVFSFFALQDLHMSAFQLGVVMSANEVAQLLSSISCGRLADSFGRRIIYCCCVSWMTICIGMMAIVQNFWQLLIVRAFAGIGQIGEPLASTIVTDFFSERKERALSLGRLYFVVSVAFVCGTTLSTLSMKHFGFSHRHVLVLSCFFGLIASSFSSLCLEESLPSSKRRPLFNSEPGQSATSSIAYFGNVGLAWIWAARFFASFAMMAWYSTYAALVKSTLGWGAVEFGYVLIATGILGALVQGFLYPPFAQQFGRHGAAVTGLLLYTISLLLMVATLHVNVQLHLCICGCAAAGISFSAPAFPDLVGAYVIEPGHMGIAQGWVAGAKSIGMIIGPVVAGFLFDHKGPFIANACGACAAVLAGASVIAAYYFGTEVATAQDVQEDSAARLM